MNKENRRRHALVMGLSLALGVGLLAALWMAASQSDAPRERAEAAWAQTAATQEPLERFMQERAQIRQQEIRQLDAIIEEERTDADMRHRAQSQKLELVTWMEQEVTLEGLLRARGYADVVVSVHRDSVNVLVKTPLLTQQDGARILELVSRETGQTGGNIKIIPLN